MSYPSGRVLSYHYDASGRITAVESVKDGQQESLASNIERLPFGPLSALTLGNGITRSRSYDQDYRVENISDGGVFARGYAFDALDNITAITDLVKLDQSQMFTYDALDRLDFATGGYGELSYSYDGIGNRLTKTQALDALSESDTYNYAVDSHRLQSVSASQTYRYDPAGNTVADGQRSFTYNQRGRMSSATADGVSTNYQRNGLGQRVLKMGSERSTHFVYDLEGRLIAEMDDSGAIEVEYAYLDGEPLAMWRDEPLQGEVIPISPLDTTDTANPVYSWQDLGTADRYQLLVYDRTSPGAWEYNAHHSTGDICTGGVCQFQPTDVSLGYANNHYWRVRAKNSAGWGEWSAQFVFDYVDALPGIVTTIAPLVSTTTATPAYEWQDLGNASDYRLRIYDRALATWVHDETYSAEDICGSGSCSITPAGLILNQSINHLWRIRALNSGGWGDWTLNQKFNYIGGQ